MLRRVLLIFAAMSIAFAALPPGRPLPDLPVLLSGGKQIPLKQFRGKPVLLVIFSTTCKDCEEIINLLDKRQAEWANQGLQIVTAAVEPEAARMVGTWLIHNKKPYPVGYLDLDPYRKIANVKPEQTAHVPILLFIDPQGIVRVQFFGDDPLLKTLERTVRNTVQELLKEPRQAPAAKR